MDNEDIQVIIPLQYAMFCVQCEVIFNKTKTCQCPVCGSISTVYLGEWINKK